MDAIGRGENMDPLLARLRAEERRKKELIDELDQLTKRREMVELDEARLKRGAARPDQGMPKPPTSHRGQARQMLRKLLGEPLMCEAIVENGRTGTR